tara:strand:+ start:760 stop:1323 length:564 start_codon:yes stop_codon:yes gene_type:complete
MKRKINEKGTYPKVCVDCEVVLNPGVNCYYSMYSRKSYKCKVCKKKQSEKEHIKSWALPSYRARKAAYLKIYQNSEPAGVYAIYNKDEIIYIGQSKQPRHRINGHFSKYINLNPNQFAAAIPTALAKGELNRDDLSWDVLYYEEDAKKRMEIEKMTINNHNKIHGQYPKFNIYYTKDKKRQSGGKLD